LPDVETTQEKQEITTMASLTLRGVFKSFGATMAVHPVDMEVGNGEFVTLLGPSGCGKSTLLRMVSGITAASGGTIELDGRRIESLPPEQRDVAMVFQSYALFPHMSVQRNLSFGLRMKKVPEPEQKRRLAHAVDICKLGALLDRMPRQLSGGQQQRVALARAIVMQPALLLFDEPLSNLDAKLRESLRDDLIALHRSVGTTSIYVTHDQAEAMAMSDRILVMSEGRIVESGDPVSLYRQPRHPFTARFLGQTNLLTLRVEGGMAVTPWGQAVEVQGLPGGARETQVSLRPEELAMRADTAGPARVTTVSFGGSQSHYTLELREQVLRAARPGHEPLHAVGDRVALSCGALRAMDGAPAS
jgi:putative spermidine/putrescine transport system ATP-binding protein